MKAVVFLGERKLGFMEFTIQRRSQAKLWPKSKPPACAAMT